MQSTEKRGKRIIWSISISVAIILGAWILIRITNIYNIYKIPSTGCSPQFEPGDIVTASNLKSFKRGDYVCYKSHTIYYTEKDIFIAQLIAMEGDTLELKAGIVYINGLLAEDTMKLKLAWIRDDLNIDDPAFMMGLDQTAEIFPFYDSGYAVQNMTIAEAKALHLRRFILPENYFEAQKSFIGDNRWNRDWMGPYIIPKGYTFLLGNNRCNSLDCRYRGPIPIADIVATVL